MLAKRLIFTLSVFIRCFTDCCCFDKVKNSLENLSQPGNEPQDDWKYSTQFYKLFTGGLSEIMWESFPPLLDNDKLNVSANCKVGLKKTYDGLRSGSEWAYRFVDSSGKTPPGFLEGTLSAFGDFDECIALNVAESGSFFSGKYCMVTFDQTSSHVEDQDPQATGSVATRLTRFMPYANYLLPHFGLCVPSSCSHHDLQAILDFSFRDYPFELREVVSCDTRESINGKYAKLSVEQMVSIAFLCTLGLVIALASYHDLRRPHENGVLVCFSVGRNMKRLFASDGDRINLIDYSKIGFTAGSVLLHCIACIDNPMGFLILDKIGGKKDVLESFFFQLLANDAALGIMFVLGGVITSHVVGASIKKGKFNAYNLVLQNWLRYLPGITGLIALQFCWPLLASGPLYTRMSQSILDNCSNNWWTSVLLVSNLRSCLDMCIPHTFHYSIDFQLFILGIIAVYLLYNRRALGCAFSVGMIFLGMLSTGYYTYVLKTTPCLITFDVNVEKVVEYMDYIHESLQGNLTTYFIGILVGYLIDNGFHVRFQQDTKRRMISFAIALSVLGSFGPCLHNTYHVLPQSWAPFYLIIHKVSYVVGLVAILLCTAPGKHAEPPAEREKSATHPLKAKDEYSIIKGICKLHFSIYLINYYIIRYHFFTSRLLFESTFYDYLKRVSYTLLFSVGAGFSFHITFEAPFANLRKMFIINDRKHVTGESGNHYVHYVDCDGDKKGS